MSDSAAVIAAANSKGGCGKSTTILILAGEYAAQGCAFTSSTPTRESGL